MWSQLGIHNLVQVSNNPKSYKMLLQLTLLFLCNKKSIGAITESNAKAVSPIQSNNLSCDIRKSIGHGTYFDESPNT